MQQILKLVDKGTQLKTTKHYLNGKNVPLMALISLQIFCAVMNDFWLSTEYTTTKWSPCCMYISLIAGNSCDPEVSNISTILFFPSTKLRENTEKLPITMHIKDLIHWPFKACNLCRVVTHKYRSRVHSYALTFTFKYQIKFHLGKMENIFQTFNNNIFCVILPFPKFLLMYLIYYIWFFKGQMAMENLLGSRIVS